VTIRVVDEIDEPVEGALVVIRSKWNNYYRTSIWDYTDPEGYCHLELGNPATGSCVVDVITPLGNTGTEYFIVRENEECEYTYTLPGRFNGRILDSSSFGTRDSTSNNLEVSINVIEEEQRPQNFSTGRGTSLAGRKLYEVAGYYGTRWYSEPNYNTYGVYSAMVSASEYENFLETHELPEAKWTKDDNYIESFSPDAGDVCVFYNPNRYTHVGFNVSLAAQLPSEDPAIELTSVPTSARTGESVVFEGNASDNLHVAQLLVSFNNGIGFINITDSYDRATGNFTYTWNTSAEGPILSGEYPIVFCVEDCSGMSSDTDRIFFMLEDAREFHDQVIFQDNPDSPLPESSWMLGPFTVGNNERFLGIQCESAEPGFDADLLLFHDGNGNRMLDGMNEQIASSTSPTAVETILRNDPQPGVYWIFCQGWLVDDRTDIDLWEGIRNLPAGQLLALDPMDTDKMVAYALIDLSLSFDFNPAFIIDINPSSELCITNPEITGRFRDGFNIDPDSFRISSAVGDIAEIVLVDDEGFIISFDALAIGEGIEYPLQIEAGTTDGRYDRVELILTGTIPERVRIEHSITGDAENISVAVRLLEDDALLEMARARIDELPWVALDPDETLASASQEISLTGLEVGEHNLTVEYRIVGGDLESTELTFEFNRNIQQKLISLLPGDGSNVYDHRSVLVAYFSLEIRDDIGNVNVFLDNVEITDSTIITADGIIYLPLEIYTKGEHTFGVIVILTDGTVIEGSSTFTILSMDEVEE
ncbi:hypothetical protein KAU08_05115, partial [bacterium]|nr:hypothetical protein [bacterium]